MQHICNIRVFGGPEPHRLDPAKTDNPELKTVAERVGSNPRQSCRYNGFSRPMASQVPTHPANYIRVPPGTWRRMA
jgi:hypothetical protein